MQPRRSSAASSLDDVSRRLFSCPGLVVEEEGTDAGERVVLL